MKTNDHYNILNDPNLHRLAELLREFIIEYKMSEEKALAEITKGFQLMEADKERLKTLAQLKDVNNAKRPSK